MSFESGSHQPARSRHTLDRYLREPEVLQLAGISQMTLYRWEAAGLFPKRYRIGPNSVAWKESDLIAWIASREIADIASIEGDA